KTIMGYVNSWGASVVIVGALFKIMHFPGASIMLIAGMLVEAFIFFLSAFEPPMEHYDWSRVFPELGKHDLKHDAIETSAKSSVAAVSGGKASLPAVAMPAIAGNVDLGLETDDLNRLKAGICKIAETADNFASVVGKTPDVAEKMTKISESFDELGARTQEMSKALQNSVEGFSSGYNDINRLLVDSAQSLTDQIKSNCEKLAGTIGESAGSFSALNKLMEEQCQQLKSNAGDYTQQLAGVNKNISALNALYELQIHETKSCLESFRGMQGDMGEMLENVSLSLDSTKLFKQESQQLANNVASLNSVYGNMLSVVNNN
ncbi:MAG: gliding motility protein GldL, partial [Odoribacter sp.]|nr:gliding motility protein GldL [Odoribacter sp.]